MEYNRKLQQNVTELSNNDEWDIAKTEWIVTGYFEEQDKQCDHSCICGKKGLRQLFKILNTKNGNDICNIGSECMKQFEFNSYETNKAKILAMKHKILKAPGSKYDGKEFCEIVKDVSYIKFIKQYSYKKCYEKLITYYDTI